MKHRIKKLITPALVIASIFSAKPAQAKNLHSLSELSKISLDALAVTLDGTIELYKSHVITIDHAEKIMQYAERLGTSSAYNCASYLANYENCNRSVGTQIEFMQSVIELGK